MISCRPFGETPDGRKAQLFILESSTASAYVTDFGGHLVSFNVPDKNGILTDVVLGFDNVVPYAGSVGYMGATVGRHANRIADGKFVLHDITYRLAVNNGPNHLHGGQEGFNHKLFDAYVDGDTLTLSYKSKDMEEGYPGNLDFSVSYRLTDEALELTYKAVCDKDTVVNFTNHSYFNCDGALNAEMVYGQYLTVYADGYCRSDENGLANGEIVPVGGTEMDFRKSTLLGSRLENPTGDIKATGGIDHNFVLAMKRGEMKRAAELYSPKTGIRLTCETDQPGIQIYTANFTDEDSGKGMTHYGLHSAVCLETQNFPNATSFSYFPSPVLRAGESFVSRTNYHFSAE